MNRTLFAASGITGLLAIATGPVQAESDGTVGDAFTLSPYVWGSNIDGTVSPSRLAPDADPDADFGEMDQLDQGWGVAGDARWGRFGVMADYSTLEFSDNASVPGGSTDFNIDTEIANLAAYYRVDDHPDMDIDLYAGGRWWNVDTELELGSTPFTTSQDKDWTDFMVGARLQYKPGQNWYFKGLGDYGQGDSDESWQLYAAGGYEFTPNWSAELGYRMLQVDYEEDGFLYDVTHGGVLAGVNFKF